MYLLAKLAANSAILKQPAKAGFLFIKTKMLLIQFDDP